jgi:hypothetical protein
MLQSILTSKHVTPADGLFFLGFSLRAGGTCAGGAAATAAVALTALGARSGAISAAVDTNLAASIVWREGFQGGGTDSTAPSSSLSLPLHPAGGAVATVVDDIIAAST